MKMMIINFIVIVLGLKLDPPVRSAMPHPRQEMNTNVMSDTFYGQTSETRVCVVLYLSLTSLYFISTIFLSGKLIAEINIGI